MSAPQTKSDLPPPSLTGEITFSTLVHYNGKGALSNRLRAIIDVEENQTAHLTYVDDKELKEPLELYYEGDGVGFPGPVGPTKLVWKSKGSTTVEIRDQTIYISSAKLVQHYYPNIPTKRGHENRFGNGWFAEAELALGDEGQQIFKDAPIVPFQEQQQ
ncbi:hypothetical protein TWF730_005897 [Orbilia blumenaviensis]|uniref:Uncharacterized protein n=1 Tax=Orbilia blumenaviensis TaxID=1796055 RepID=A0AAV9VJQ0_9PEZI